MNILTSNEKEFMALVLPLLKFKQFKKELDNISRNIKDPDKEEDFFIFPSYVKPWIEYRKQVVFLYGKHITVVYSKMAQVPNGKMIAFREQDLIIPKIAPMPIVKEEPKFNNYYYVWGLHLTC